MEPGDESQDPQMCIDPVLDTITVESDGAALCLNTQPSIPGRLPSEPVTTKDASPSAESQQPLALEPRQTADERPLPLGNQDLDILRPADLVRSEPRGPAQGDVSSHAVFSWDLPSPWPLNSIDMSFNMAESPHQLPSLPQTGLTPFFWEDFSRSESVGSIGLVLSPANLGSQDDGSASGSTVGDHSMPWMAPWAPLANVTDILSSESTSQLYRAVPKVTDADVQKYWDLYFDRFHPGLPLLHDATMVIHSCDPYLRCAILGIGASYDPNPAAQEFSLLTIGRLCVHLTKARSQEDKTLTKYTITHWVLCGIVYYHILQCASPCLVDFALAAHASIVREWQHSWLGMRTDDIIRNTDKESTPKPGSSHHQQTLSTLKEEKLAKNWHSWVLKEQRKRLAWILTIIDFRCSALIGSWPKLTYEELNNLYMPSKENLWKAPDPKSWRVKFPFTASPPRTAPFLGILRQGEVTLKDETLSPFVKMIVQGGRILVKNHLLTPNLEALFAEVSGSGSVEDSLSPH